MKHAGNRKINGKEIFSSLPQRLHSTLNMNSYLYSQKKKFSRDFKWHKLTNIKRTADKDTANEKQNSKTAKK